MDRKSLLDDAQWDLIQPLLPPQRSGKGRPMRDHRQVVEGVIYRYRCGIAWRDLPVEFGPWQTVWKRHRRFSADGTWDKVLAALLAQADAAQQVDWTVSVDSTINRAHQHATNLPREPKQPAQPAVHNDNTEHDSTASAAAVAELLVPDTGGWIELQGSTRSCRSAGA
jgi:transposase